MRISKREEIEKKLGKTIWEVFAELKNIKTLEDVRDQILRITQGINISPATIQKNIEEALISGELNAQSPFLAWIPEQDNTPKRRGRISMREQIEEKTNMNLFAYIEKNCSSAKTATEAAIIIEKNTAIGCSEKTLLKYIQDAIDSKEIKPDSFVATLIPIKEAPGKRGKASMRDLIEQRLKCKLFDLFTQKFSNIDTIEQAAKYLTEISGINCSVNVLIATINRALEASEITQDAFFTKWLPTVKKHNKKAPKASKIDSEGNAIPEPKKVNGIVVMASLKCSHCTHEAEQKSVLESYFKDCLVLGLKGNRCPKCNKFGTYTAEFIHNGQTFRKAVIDNGIYAAEEYVDKKGNRIENPFETN